MSRWLPAWQVDHKHNIRLSSWPSSCCRHYSFNWILSKPNTLPSLASDHMTSSAELHPLSLASIDFNFNIQSVSVLKLISHAHYRPHNTKNSLQRRCWRNIHNIPMVTSTSSKKMIKTCLLRTRFSKTYFLSHIFAI